MVIAMPADGLAPNGARPSAGTALTGKLRMSSYKFRRVSMIPYHNFGLDDVI